MVHSLKPRTMFYGISAWHIYLLMNELPVKTSVTACNLKFANVILRNIIA
jgi:hypothetical protein